METITVCKCTLQAKHPARDISTYHTEGLLFLDDWQNGLDRRGEAVGDAFLILPHGHPEHESA